MNSIAILNDVADEIEQHPERWSQGSLASDEIGHCSLISDGVTWCLAGHLFRRDIHWMDGEIAWAISDILGKGPGYISIWNDHWWRTARSVVKLCRKAAKRLQEHPYEPRSV